MEKEESMLVETISSVVSNDNCDFCSFTILTSRYGNESTIILN